MNHNTHTFTLAAIIPILLQAFTRILPAKNIPLFTGLLGYFFVRANRGEWGPARHWVQYCNLKKKFESLKLRTADINIFHHRAFTRVSLKKVIIVK